MVERFALVIGAMKAATTTVVDHLAQHPQIAAATPKEPGYFAFDAVFDKGLDWYGDLFSFDPDQHLVRIEGSTDYSKHPHAPGTAERIRAFAAGGRDVRLIYTMRHPLRRIESHARHTQRARCELGRTVSPRPDHSLDAGVSALSLDACRYALQIDQYRDFYDDGRLFLTTLERLSANGPAVMADICRFLGVDPALLPPQVERRNEKIGFRYKKTMPLGWRMAASLPPVRMLAKALVPEATRRRLKKEARPREALTGRFELTAAESAAILADLAPDMRRLRDVYGLDATAEWGISL